MLSLTFVRIEVLFSFDNTMFPVDGSCMMDFMWDSGGNWNNTQWNADLPTDSALLLYLFTAFLSAPQWLFQEDNDSKIEGPEGTLYLGKIPSRVAGHYLAITSTRVSSGSKVRVR